MKCLYRLPWWLRWSGFDPWVGKIPWRRAWQATPVFLPGESPWTEEPGDHGITESDMTEPIVDRFASEQSTRKYQSYSITVTTLKEEKAVAEAVCVSRWCSEASWGVSGPESSEGQQHFGVFIAPGFIFSWWADFRLYFWGMLSSYALNDWNSPSPCLGYV